MIMFLNLRKQLAQMITQLNKNQLNVKDCKKILISMLGDKFNYPIFLTFGSSRRDIINLKKSDILTDLQNAIDYIDKNNQR